MKKLNYASPNADLVELSTADVIAASVTVLGDDGVIELRSYGFSMSIDDGLGG